MSTSFRTIKNHLNTRITSLEQKANPNAQNRVETMR